MKQRSFASSGFEARKKPTPRERFPGEKAVPWADLPALLEPSYTSSGRRGRPRMAPATMLRIYFMQQRCALSDPAMEGMLHETKSTHRLAGQEPNGDAIPDGSTNFEFRRFLEQHSLAADIPEAVNMQLSSNGPLLRHGAIVDATIIRAAPSTHAR